MLASIIPPPMATGENLFSLQDAAILIRYAQSGGRIATSGSRLVDSELCLSNTFEY